ncbi:MAG: cytochrome P450, partial [Gammaproteobacteria bacterium]|nr:cytochrome P450 [Gammaproteobacteria bacterium]
IAELLGVPATQREDFKRWSDCLVRVLNERQGPAWERARTGVFELVAYFRECLDARRPHASDEGDGGDLIDVLLAAERRGELQAREMVPYCTLLLGAGNETTTNLIGGMTIALLDNPDQLALLQERPELLPQAVEEALRFCSPVQALYRRATRDLEIQDVHIAAGQDLALCYGSANRDPRKFEEPDRFDILRDTAGHLGFGYGIHHCLGAHLARREARAVFKQLLPLLPKLTRVDEQVHWAPSWVVRGPDRLPLQRVA